jgi:hypothetical protein
MGQHERYPDIPSEWNARVFIRRALNLYTYAEPDEFKGVLPVHIGAYFNDGTTEDGFFGRESTNALLKNLGFQSLEQLNQGRTPAFAHIICQGGSCGGRTLYGISVEEESTVHRAELNMEKLFPEWHW